MRRQNGLGGNFARTLAVAAFAWWIIPAASAAEMTVAPLKITEYKAVFGQVETRSVVPARARIGGTLTELTISEGSAVKAGQVIAKVVDDKLALQLQAADARIRALQSQLENARSELERAQALIARGTTTQQRLDQARMQTNVFVSQINAAKAERAVIVQQSTEGAVLAPVTGRVLKVPVSKGAVLMPGEAVATVAGGGFYLRLALPERHAGYLKVGAEVKVGSRGGISETTAATGKLVKIYPQIENGRVMADVEVAGLGDFFVGERVLVRVPVAERMAISVPANAVVKRTGIDFVKISENGTVRQVAVIPGGNFSTPKGTMTEILTGLKTGDKVVLP
ncbi:MAG: efflux RND transporter periplasmic adaptor subunit [Hyphomicrobiales bacterium]|nr:efflux RND transporter periplasmic adaptor subunit [Hyphomicrobiales bacterium]